MGYWRQSEEGHSLQTYGDLIWGDAPADAMGSALQRICEVFVRDINRLPTEAEVKAGLLFSLSVALERAEEKKQFNMPPFEMSR